MGHHKSLVDPKRFPPKALDWEVTERQHPDNLPAFDEANGSQNS
jgi:hypothetical protein